MSVLQPWGKRRAENDLMSAAISQPSFVLASASPRRQDLLARLGVVPSSIVPAHIDETPLKKETPRLCVVRLAGLKATTVAADCPDAFVLGADTIVASGRRILPKALDERTADWCLSHLSGRRHRVYTAVCVVTPEGRLVQRVVQTSVRFCVLSDERRRAYLASGEWHGKAGGYALQGKAEAFVSEMIGSWSNVVGLPLYETDCLLRGLGISGP